MSHFTPYQKTFIVLSGLSGWPKSQTHSDSKVIYLLYLYTAAVLLVAPGGVVTEATHELLGGAAVAGRGLRPLAEVH